MSLLCLVYFLDSVVPVTGIQSSSSSLVLSSIASYEQTILASDVSSLLVHQTSLFSHSSPPSSSSSNDQHHHLNPHHHHHQHRRHNLKVLLPSLVWAPVRSRHRQFPQEFREIVKMILVASNRCDYYYRINVMMTGERSGSSMKHQKCLCSLLPTPIWFHILSYASRYVSFPFPRVWFVSNF
jgi:hypothetical protein